MKGVEGHCVRYEYNYVAVSLSLRQSDTINRWLAYVHLPRTPCATIMVSSEVVNSTVIYIPET